MYTVHTSSTFAVLLDTTQNGNFLHYHVKIIIILLIHRYVYNSQSQIRFTLHMILAHVLVAIDYYAKCPNLKKPDSLSSTYSNATHYSKILKKVFAKSLKNHFFSTLKKCTFFQHSSTVAEKT